MRCKVSQHVFAELLATETFLPYTISCVGLVRNYRFRRRPIVVGWRDDWLINPISLRESFFLCVRVHFRDTRGLVSILMSGFCLLSFRFVTKVWATLPMCLRIGSMITDAQKDPKTRVCVSACLKVPGICFIVNASRVFSSFVHCIGVYYVICFCYRVLFAP